jgi:two-component system, LuxR family, response regulator FixJ
MGLGGALRDGWVFVLDEDAGARSRIHGLLSAAGFRVCAFASAPEFLRHKRPSVPACLVLEQCLHDTCGLRLQDQCADDQGLSFIFVTACKDISTVVRAMKKGAVDFLSKPTDHGSLVSAVRRGMERSARAAEERRRREEFGARLLRLTCREHQVVRGVLRGLLNKQIALELGTAEKTVKVHRARAMEKLEVDSLAELVRIAEQTQLLSSPAGPPAIDSCVSPATVRGIGMAAGPSGCVCHLSREWHEI